MLQAVNNPATVFELRSARVGYNGHAVLDGVDLRIAAGEHVALVGRSGAGKSTLLRLLYGQQPRDTALVPQELGLVQTLTLFHNVYIGALHRHTAWYNLVNLLRPLHREVDAVAGVVRRLGLVEKLFTAVGELSGGQQQRAAVGRALYQRGRVLLGDEPVSAVDERQSHDVLAAIAETHETVVLAMHDVALALQYSDRVVGLRDGGVALDESTRGLTAAELAPLYSPD